MTTTQTGSARAAGRRERLPVGARRAVRDLEVAFVTGTDADYQGALRRLEAACVDLSAAQRERLERALGAARERAQQAAHLLALARALAGPWTVVAALPGDVELVSLVGPDDGQMLATVPAVRDGDDPAVAELVAGARAALAAARCARCDGALDYRVDGAVHLAHARRCPFTEERIAARRAGNPARP